MNCLSHSNLRRSGYILWVHSVINLDAVMIVLRFKTEKKKENHGQAFAPNGAVGLKPWGSHASKLAVCPMALTHACGVKPAHEENC